MSDTYHIRKINAPDEYGIAVRIRGIRPVLAAAEPGGQQMFIRQNETMVVLWSRHIRHLVDDGFVDLVEYVEQPAASQYFPTVEKVLEMIDDRARTLPGESVLGVAAEGSDLIFKVGKAPGVSRDIRVTLPALTNMAEEVQRAKGHADRAEQTEARIGAVIDQAVNDAVAQIDSEAMTYAAISGAAAQTSLHWAEESKRWHDSIPAIEGPPGPRGPEGERGLTGARGLTGPKGDEGERGTQGLQGARGPAGDRGPAGPQGPRGLTGNDGKDGASVSYEGMVATYGDLPVGLGTADAGKAWVVNSDGRIYPWDGSAFPAAGNAPEFRGPRGERGERGEIGPAGPVGPEGPEGPRGPQGAVGERGERGLTGAKGDRGFRGYLGPAGPSSYQHAVDEGFSGDLDAWLASLVGPPGQQGIQGAQGERGPAGPQGERGERGIQGVRGDNGTNGANGTNGYPFRLVGEVSNPTQLPSGATAGDAYAIASTGQVAQWNGALWSTPAQFRGPAGPQGERGLRGEQGSTGQTGQTGQTGPAGSMSADQLVGAFGQSSRTRKPHGSLRWAGPWYSPGPDSVIRLRTNSNGRLVIHRNVGGVASITNDDPRLTAPVDGVYVLMARQIFGTLNGLKEASLSTSLTAMDSGRLVWAEGSPGRVIEATSVQYLTAGTTVYPWIYVNRNDSGMSGGTGNTQSEYSMTFIGA